MTLAHPKMSGPARGDAGTRRGQYRIDHHRRLPLGCISVSSAEHGRTRQGPGEATVTTGMRVVLIDGQPLVRSGMRVALVHDPALVVVGEAASVAEAVAADDALQPDAVVLGVANGPLSVRAVRQHWPDAAVLLVSSAVDPPSVRRAFERGVAGVVLPTVDGAEFVRALRVVACGERYLTPAVGVSLVRDVHKSDSGVALSVRERDVLRLLALGHTNHEIAQTLVVSVRTVEGHRAHMMAKLDVTSRAELVRHALTVGLLDDELARSERVP